MANVLYDKRLSDRKQGTGKSTAVSGVWLFKSWKLVKRNALEYGIFEEGRFSDVTTVVGPPFDKCPRLARSS